MENKKIMKDMNRIRVTVIGFIAALAASVMGVDKVQAQEFKIQGDLVSSYVWLFVDGMGLYRF